MNVIHNAVQSKLKKYKKKTNFQIAIHPAITNIGNDQKISWNLIKKLLKVV